MGSNVGSKVDIAERSETGKMRGLQYPSFQNNFAQLQVQSNLLTQLSHSISLDRYPSSTCRKEEANRRTTTRNHGSLNRLEAVRPAAGEGEVGAGVEAVEADAEGDQAGLKEVLDPLKALRHLSNILGDIEIDHWYVWPN